MYMIRRLSHSIFRKINSGLQILVVFAVFHSAIATTVTGQSDTSVSTDQTADGAPSVPELRKNYEIATEELRAAIKAIKKTGADYYQNKSTVAFEHREKWEEEAVIAESAYAKLRSAAFALFFALDNPDDELSFVIQQMNRKLSAQGQLTNCYRATKKLLEQRPGDPGLTRIMGQVSIMTNDFETALEYYQTHQEDAASFGMPERALYNSVELLNTKYQRELELRESDAKGEELPQAILKVTNVKTGEKGTIVIELFENQAPETVGNFINLVQTGFYDGIIFHRVLRNILADTGKMTMNRAQPVGYTIYDESKRPDARHHFRGTVTMVLNNDEEHSGAAEFRIMLVPGPNMDGKNTAFGRVVSGMEVLDSIQETFTINEEEGKEEFVRDVMPDTIESITVKRLRDHPYEPNRVKE